MTDREKNLLHIIDTQQKVIEAAREATKTYRQTATSIRPAALNKALYKLELRVIQCDKATGATP